MALLCFAMALLMKKQNRREYIATDNKSCTEKMVAITFDDGPSQLTTPVLLKGLKERGICATFFLVGENAVDNPGLVKQMSQEGHVIGNHTFSHIILNRVSMKNALEEIMKTNEVIEKITGKPVKYIRPPCGEYDDELLYSVNLRPVMWDVDPEDWKCHNVRTLVDRVVKNVKDGDIISINIPEYSIELKVSDEEIEDRKKTMKIKRKTDIGGALARYAAQVSSADKGAVINKFKG